MTSPGFPAALARALRYEGGFVDHPDDPGGPTNKGITQRTYDAYRRRLGLATRTVRLIEDPEVEAIYYRDYWIPAGCAERPPALAAALFDAAVHHGLGNALRFAAEAHGDWRRMMTERQRFMTNLSAWPVFGRGWMRRLADLTDAAAALDDAAHRPAPRLLIVHEADGAIAAQTPIPADLLIRVTPTKIYTRPDTPQGGTA